MTTYTPTIGLEIHAELNTKSKMFCGCKNDPHHTEPNLYVCPVCMAHPGTLPVANEKAIEKILLFGQAIDAKVAGYTEFDRKNYFYPDIPKAYQISQYKFPFVAGGNISGVEITRVHLEEDTARSQHSKEGSIVNFNRAGVPLMELVTEPVIHDAKTAGDFARELQLILQTLELSNAQMERGEMRVEANISVSPNSELGTKVEVKNLNSFRSVEQAIEYEIARQTKILENKGQIKAETRGWDEEKQRTFAQRSKETAKDYRYFPDPDLPKMDIDQYEPFTKSRLNEKIPLLPSDKREKYSYLGLTREQTEILLQDTFLDKFFLSFVNKHPDNVEHIKLAVNYLTSDAVALFTTKTDYPSEYHTESLFSLVDMCLTEKIGSRTAKNLLEEVLYQGIDPNVVAKERNLIQANSEADLLPVIEQVVTDNPSVVEEVKAGKDTAIQYLVGQGMKATKGSANPTKLRELLQDKLKND